MSLNLKKSHELYDRATTYLPGGVNSPVRSFMSVGGKPFVAAKADGARIYDVDANEYIDLVCSWGPLIHGHNHPRIREAIQKTLEKGASFGISCEIEYDLAEFVVSKILSVEMIRLVNSGTEACMSAIRLARAFTKRDIIVKFEGHYHGHADSFLIAAGSGLATLGGADSAGVPEESLKSTLILKFNDLDSIEEGFKQYGDRIAGVMLEAVTGNMGVVLPKPEFMQKLRKLCEHHKSLLIFDEVMTGFRLSFAGAQGLLGESPDISCFGKIIGGGLPVGAYGGRREIMQTVAPLGPMYQAGTLSGNPLGAAAGLESLKMIDEGGDLFFQSLDSKTAELASQLKSHIELKSYPVSVSQVGSMLTVFFRKEIPSNYQEAKECDLECFKRFFWALLERGVYYPPSQFEACFLSTAHDEAAIDQIATQSIAALDQAMS